MCVWVTFIGLLNFVIFRRLTNYVPGCKMYNTSWCSSEIWPFRSSNSNHLSFTETKQWSNESIHWGTKVAFANYHYTLAPRQSYMVARKCWVKKSSGVSKCLQGIFCRGWAKDVVYSFIFIHHFVILIFGFENGDGPISLSTSEMLYMISLVS